MFRLCATLTAISVACQPVISYENVYDLIERQRGSFRSPDGGFPETREIYIDRHPIFNGKRGSLRPPARYDSFGFRGNGYDNIGNGNVRARDRLHFFPEEAPYQRRYPVGFDHFYQLAFPAFHDSYYYSIPRHDVRRFDFDKRSGGRVYEEKGDSDVYKIDSAVANNEGNNQRNLLENFRDNKLSIVNDARKKENFGESSHSDKTNENKSTIRSNRVIKKGHVTKGFSTHHHKDETGNTTTFYDEFSDHGGQDDYRDVADGFGTKSTSNFFTDVEDGKFFKETGGESGNYGTGSVADTRKTENNYISNDNRFDRGGSIRVEGVKSPLGNLKNRSNYGYAPYHIYSQHNY